MEVHRESCVASAVHAEVNGGDDSELCDKSLARLIRHLKFTWDYRQLCHVETKPVNASKVYSKTPILLEIEQIQSQHPVECSVHLVIVHSYKFCGHGRNRRQWHTATQKLR